MKRAVLLLAAACGDAGAARDSGVDDDAPKPVDAALPPDAYAPIEVDYRFLSETGLYADLAARTLADGVEPFRPEFELWSDGAAKSRYVHLPSGAAIDTSDMDRWRFPPGTKLWKEFADPDSGEPIETRLIMRLGPEPEHVFMTSFVWNADGSDAVRAESGAAIARDDVTVCPSEPTAEDPTPACHFVPAEDRCQECHQGQPHAPLGFQAVSLSFDNPGGVDLAELVAVGRLSAPPPDGATYPVPGEGVARAAIGYLHANCGHCHASDFGGPESCYGLTSFETRVYVADRTVEDTAVYRTGVNELLTFWSRAEGNRFDVNCRISPGSPAMSALYHRVAHRDGWVRPHVQMPPAFSAAVDPSAVATIEAWIADLPGPPSGLCAAQCANGWDDDGDDAIDLTDPECESAEDNDETL